MSVAGNAYFSLEPRGDILAGAILPERRLPLPPTNGSVPPPLGLPRRAGLDVLRAYAETDCGDVSGESVGEVPANCRVSVVGREVRHAYAFAVTQATRHANRVTA